MMSVVYVEMAVVFGFLALCWKKPVAGVAVAGIVAAVVPAVLFPPQAFVGLTTYAKAGERVPDLPEVQEAVVYSRFSDSGMALETIPVPTLREGEVMVEIHATAINPVDYKMGQHMPFVAYIKPVVGFDVSGVVVASRSPAFNVGDEVFGESEWGALTQYAAVRAELLASKPAGLSHEEAASVVMAWKTSYEALAEIGGVKEGSKVLILGGSGGCGSYGVQIAKQLGARVVATCSTRNVDFVKGLGADVVVDYKKHSDLTEALASEGVFDVVYDSVGQRKSMAEARTLLQDQGWFVTIAQPVFPWDRLGGMSVKHFTMRFNADNLEPAQAMVAEGKLKTEIQQVFSLNEFEKAFNLLKSRRVRGKLVFKMAQ